MCPKTELPEYAFIGRSNVGKSSLINMLTGKKKLAMTSSTPGKTMLINHFLINSSWYLVDLPGYGFALRGKREMDKLWNLISHYVLDREQLTCLFVLIDIRHEPQKKDLDFLQFLGENGVPFAIIFTKADKLTKIKGAKNVEAYIEFLKESWEELPPHFITSSSKGTGKDEVLDYIESINQSL
jgi:GTP-binding protein